VLEAHEAAPQRGGWIFGMAPGVGDDRHVSRHLLDAPRWPLPRGSKMATITCHHHESRICKYVGEKAVRFPMGIEPSPHQDARRTTARRRSTRLRIIIIAGSARRRRGSLVGRCR